MDAGKINSLTHGLRPNIGGSHAGPSPGDAAFAAKVAAVVVLDDLLEATKGDPRVAPGVVAALPLALKTGVIVNLSPGSVAAEMAARLGSALPRPPESVLPLFPSVAPTAAHAYGLAERLGDANRVMLMAGAAASTVSAEDKRAPGAMPSLPGMAAMTGVAAMTGLPGSSGMPALPGVPAMPGLPLMPGMTALPGSPVSIAASPVEGRNDLYAVAPVPMGHTPRPEAVEQRSHLAAAIEQARHSERLAGLHVKGATEPEVPPRWMSLERIVLGALALGVLVVLFL